MPSAEASIPGPADATSAADYVAAMSGDLATIARRHGFAALGYILDMAQLEAQALAEQGGRAGDRAPN